MLKGASSENSMIDYIHLDIYRILTNIVNRVWAYIIVAMAHEIVVKAFDRKGFIFHFRKPGGVINSVSTPNFS